MPSILVTGVSTGIGRACVDAFLARGWNVIGTARDPTRAPGGDFPSEVPLEALDLGLPGSAKALGERVLQRHGCPDALLNNAGVVQFGPLETVAPDALVQLFRVNVFGHLELIQALLPAMRHRGSGTIANVTSLGGTMVFPFFAGYNSTKWAMEGISEGLWHELQPFGIRVKAIEPGFVETAIWGKAMPGRGEPVEGPEAYRPAMEAMRAFESSIADRTTPAAVAIEIVRAVEDPSDRLRYPVAAYARPLVRARRLFGGQRIMRFFHPRWVGDGS
jgi:NAD(P)-dependent dehydrogenase (short-subunit alcohol dehydrogenase family)